MYNVDKYFDFDFEEKKSETKQNSKKKKQKKQSLMLLLLAGAGAYYYFLIYLPEEERKVLEAQIQTDLDKVKKLQTNDYENITSLLATCQTYLLWNNQTEIKKLALKNKQKDLDSAIKWLKENQLTTEKLEDEAYKKGKIWELPIESWADKKLKSISSTLVSEYQEEVNLFPSGDKHPNFHFTRTAAYEIWFPPSLKDHYEAGKNSGENNCVMLEEKEELILSEKILVWYRRAFVDPVRGDKEKGENNALFYGMSRTGKSAIAKNLCFETNKYPLVIIKGSSLTPRLKVKMNVLEKFQYTISELEWTLVKTYGLERKANGEVGYILFVDECNQISNNPMVNDPNFLQFVKECIEGNKSSRKEETDNLWVMATNHLDQIEEAVYQSGRLSNKLSFSWTWKEFLKHAQKANIYNQLPQRWKKDKDNKDVVLNSEEDKWVKKFNIPIFYKDFIGEDKENPNKRKFWNLFITNNPDGIFKEKIEIKDKNGNKKTEIEEGEIEIGEFLEYFWDIQESSNLENYQGTFKSLKKLTTEDVLEANLPEIPDMLAQSSNELNQSLENLSQGIDQLKQQIGLSAMNNPSNLQHSINDLYKLVGELRGKIEKP